LQTGTEETEKNVAAMTGGDRPESLLEAVVSGGPRSSKKQNVGPSTVMKGMKSAVKKEESLRNTKKPGTDEKNCKRGLRETKHQWRKKKGKSWLNKIGMD